MFGIKKINMLCCHTLVLRCGLHHRIVIFVITLYSNHILFQKYIVLLYLIVSPTSSQIPAPYTLPQPYSLYYLQPHSDALHIASAIESSVSPTSSHILASDTLRPPYYPLSLLHTATSLLLIHCPHHSVFCLSYLQPHPGSLHTTSTIRSSVSPTTSHILATYTLPPPYSPPSLLPPTTSLLKLTQFYIFLQSYGMFGIKKSICYVVTLLY